MELSHSSGTSVCPERIPYAGEGREARGPALPAGSGGAARVKRTWSSAWGSLFLAGVWRLGALCPLRAGRASSGRAACQRPLPPWLPQRSLLSQIFLEALHGEKLVSELGWRSSGRPGVCVEQQPAVRSSRGLQGRRERREREGAAVGGVRQRGWHALRAQACWKLMGRLSEGEGGKLARPPCRPSASGMLCLFTTSWKPDASFSWEITSSRATGGWQDVSREIFPPAHQLELLGDQGKEALSESGGREPAGGGGASEQPPEWTPSASLFPVLSLGRGWGLRALGT